MPVINSCIGVSAELPAIEVPVLSQWTTALAINGKALMPIDAFALRRSLVAHNRNWGLHTTDAYARIDRRKRAAIGD